MRFIDSKTPAFLTSFPKIERVIGMSNVTNNNRGYFREDPPPFFEINFWSEVCSQTIHL